MFAEIQESGLDPLTLVLEKPKRSVATRAQQAAHLACLVVVVNEQLGSLACPFTVRSTATDRTLMALLF